jgi:serine/threonine protein kinase
MDFLRKLFSRDSRQKTDVTKRFNLIGRIGQGSMSKVWKAIDYNSGRTVALKVLDKEKTAKLEARFVGLKRPSEGEIAVQLKHANVVRTTEFGWTMDLEQFLVMEFVEGAGLGFLVSTQNDTYVKHRLDYMIQLGRGIEYFHQENWIHRDICPRNVMVSAEHVVKLIDFGLVVPNTPDFRKPGNRTGTANYMAPELVKRQPTDQRIDVYSFAVTCYEMWTQRMPWKIKGTSLDAVVQALNAPPDDIQDHAPQIDRKLADIIMKGLEKRPQDRWASMTQMIEALEQVQARTPTGRKV